MKKLDDYMPFILKLENIVRIENNRILIGDRRAYPASTEFVECSSVEEAAAAIESMVTQGGGPLWVALHAVKFLAVQADARKTEKIPEIFISAKKRLQQTRPTNTTMARKLEELTNLIITEINNGNKISLEKIVGDYIDEQRSSYEKSAFAMAETGAALINNGDGILTMCFAETTFILTIALALEQGKNIKIFSPETRPYLQGARLTAPSLMEIGADVTLITDGMGAYVMSEGKIQKYMTAVDIITADGWAANKIGTFQNAISANYHGIPYFPLAIDPDLSRKGRSSIVIEERNPEEVKYIKGILITREDMKAYYPAFDIIPPHLIAGVITPKGLLSPYGIEKAYSEDK